MRQANIQLFWVVPIVFRRQNLSHTLLLKPSFRKKNHLSDMRQTRFTNLGTKVLLSEHSWASVFVKCLVWPTFVVQLIC